MQAQIGTVNSRARILLVRGVQRTWNAKPYYTFTAMFVIGLMIVSLGISASAPTATLVPAQMVITVVHSRPRCNGKRW